MASKLDLDIITTLRQSNFEERETTVFVLCGNKGCVYISFMLTFKKRMVTCIAVAASVVLECNIITAGISCGILASYDYEQAWNALRKCFGCFTVLFPVIFYLSFIIDNWWCNAFRVDFHKDSVFRCYAYKPFVCAVYNILRCFLSATHCWLKYVQAHISLEHASTTFNMTIGFCYVNSDICSMCAHCFAGLFFVSRDGLLSSPMFVLYLYVGLAVASSAFIV